MINSQRCSFFCLKNIFLYHNMRQENSVSIHARTKVSSHCSIGNVVCNGHTQTLCFMFRTALRGKRVLFSQAMDILFIYNRMCMNLNTVYLFLVTSDLCDQSPLEPQSLLFPTWAENNYWLKVIHPTTKHTTCNCSKVTLDLITSFLHIARRQRVCKSCIQICSHGKVVPLSPCFHQLGTLYTGKNSVQSISKLS